MTEWREYKLKELADFNPDSLTAKNKLEFINYLDTGNITKGKIDTIQYLNLLTDKVPSRAKRIVKKNDIVYSTVRPNQEHYGIIKNPVDNMIVSTGFVVLRSKEDKCYSDFLYYFLTLPENTEYLSNVAEDSTTAYPSITPDIIMDMDISLPPLLEQKAIAEVLSSLDDKIDLLTRQNKTLEDLAQAFFRKWFVEDADEKLKKYPLSELMVIQNGFAFRSRDYQDAGKYKIVTIKNVQDGFIDTSGTTFLNQLPVGMPDYVLLTIGDVLISLTGNVGRVGIVVEDNLLLNQRVAKISPYNPEYLPFLYFYFRNETTREYLINLAHGTAQANLSPIETLKTEVSFSKTLIKKYSELFMPMYQKIIKNKQQIIVLQKLRDTLLPKLISGEVRVKL
jgi:type I restriction enzyme S subunit